KRLESAGARSLPIPYDTTPSILKHVLQGVNGLLLPGGSAPLTPIGR
ncbi:unnamed protein product, partial [Choristocarpus tenellus]